MIVPRHVGPIVDGNRRWARERGLSTGGQILEACFALDVEVVSACGLSTEK